jgi:hypothetical protein
LELTLELKPDLDGLEGMGDGDGSTGGDATRDEGAACISQ